MKYICALALIFIANIESGARYSGDTFSKTIGAVANIKEDLKKLLIKIDDVNNSFNSLSKSRESTQPHANLKNASNFDVFSGKKRLSKMPSEISDADYIKSN